MIPFEDFLFGHISDRDWKRASRLLLSGGVIECTITGYNAFGLLIRFGSLPGFIPAAEVISRPEGAPDRDTPPALPASDWLSKLVGSKLSLKVIEADRSRRRFILSERQARSPQGSQNDA